MPVRFSVNSYWGPRREDPPDIARRCRRMLDELAAISPVFTCSEFGNDRRFIPTDQLAGDRLVQLIESQVDRADDGTPTPVSGYGMPARVGREGDPRSLIATVSAGKRYPASFYINTVLMETKPLDPENTGFFTPHLLKQVMLALIAAWQPTWSAVYPTDLIKFWPEPGRGPKFRLAWMTYLSARFAAIVTPPSSLPSDRTPDGGLLMIATKDRFDTANPAHVAAAREIEDAIAPVNALPWPPDA